MTPQTATLKPLAAVARDLGISERMVRRWAQRWGIGRDHEFGRRVLAFTPAEVERLRNRPKPAEHLRVTDPSPAALAQRERRARLKIAQETAPENA